MHQINSPPFVACGAETAEIKNFLSHIQRYCNERGDNSLVQCLLRRDYAFAITNDYRLHIGKVVNNNNQNDQIFDLLSSIGLEGIGLKRVYYVAATNAHCLILVDEIVDDNLPNHFKAIECNEMFLNVLPSGETIKVPKKSTPIFFDLGEYWNSATAGKVNIRKHSNFPRDVNILPNQYLFKKDEFVTYMTCASWSQFLVTNLGRLFVLGSNSFGECGFPRYKNLPGLSLSPYSQANPNLFICKVACGAHSIFAMDSNGLIHCTGYNNGGELAVGKICEVVDAFEPAIELNKYLECDPAVDISCSCNGVVVLTKSGKLYTTGSGTVETFKQPSPFNKVMSIGGTKSSSFLLCASDGNDFLIQSFGLIDETSLLLENGAKVLNYSSAGKYRVALTGSETSKKDTTLLLYIQSHYEAECVLQNNLRQHLLDYGKKGKSFADVWIEIL